MVLAHEGKKRVFEKAAGGKCRKSAGLGHGNQVFIFVEDAIIKRHIRLIPGRATVQKQLPGFEDGLGYDLPVIDKYEAGLQAVLPNGPRRMAIFAGEKSQDSEAVASIIYFLPILVSII